MTFRNINHVSGLWLILGASFLALALAFGAEFIYHINPCVLCLAQRVPYALVIILSVIGLARSGAARGILAAAGILFLLNSGIAVYQVGIERGVWGLNDGGDSEVCTANNLSVQNVKDLYASMTGTPMGDCAHPAFNFHGITFAVINAALSFGLMIFAFAARRKNSN